MNLNEFFFFKVFQCNKDGNNKFNPGTHKEKNCYFYHVFTTYDNGIKKVIEKDRRREPILISGFFKKLLFKLKEEENFALSIDTIFDFKKICYYTDSLPFLYLNEIIFNENDCCHNETEFYYHINRYKKNDCRFFNINGKCKNKFCYAKHIINKNKNENEKNKDEEYYSKSNKNNDIDEGIIKFNTILNKWKEKKEIKLKEIIELYNYILSFENKYLSKIQINEITQDFIPFQKLLNDNKNSNDNINNRDENNINFQNIIRNQNNENISNERIIQDIYNQFNPRYNSSKIYKNSNLFESLKISTNICFISSFNYIKLGEVVKFINAFLNSSDGVIIYGGNRNNLSIKGISLKKKEREDFKKWFNTEFLKILIEYEDNLKYKFYELANNNNDEYVLIIEVKKIKINKLLRTLSNNKCYVIKEKILNVNSGKKIILNDDDILELNTKEYLELLRKRLLFHYSKKFGVNINI